MRYFSAFPNLQCAIGFYQKSNFPPRPPRPSLCAVPVSRFSLLSPQLLLTCSAFACLIFREAAMDMMNVDISTVVSQENMPKFPPLKAHGMSNGKVQYRSIRIPPHRMTPLRKVWEHEIFPLITVQMKIDVCVNRKKNRMVELKTTDETPDIDNLHKCADFVRAFLSGFDVKDAEALLRVDEMRVESFEIKDVKKLRGEHLPRAIGRLSGKGGKTKFAIENATRTRIVIADKKIYVMGTCSSLKFAKDALSSLILGSPPAKVYSKLRAVTSRAAERF